jgi:hypothetical protein
MSDAWGLVEQAFYDGAWDATVWSESDHPRKGGKFVSKAAKAVKKTAKAANKAIGKEGRVNAGLWGGFGVTRGAILGAALGGPVGALKGAALEGLAGAAGGAAVGAAGGAYKKWKRRQKQKQAAELEKIE